MLYISGKWFRDSDIEWEEGVDVYWLEDESWGECEESTKPNLARQRVRSSFDTGLARTAENRLPSSDNAWHCSYDVAAMTE